ncbi:MAG TPA: 4-hydroxy-tetrahydrodipicolinate reductase [Verrucomicrobiae bacterium]|nr:4-hydroxy-tetrahydrodipicolinate reductase [Verrucomicrobiae bacterium]
MTKILIAGPRGRMGQALLASAPQHPKLEVAGTFSRNDDLNAIIGNADVVIDFTSPEATLHIADVCARAGKALVLGTTGHEPGIKARLGEPATRIPIVFASNFSTGVNALFWLAGKAAEILGPAFDLEIVEMHHRLKKDAPSGTATTLAEILAKARHLRLEDALRHGREGMAGPRESGEIGMHSLRGGDVVGEHTVIFAGPGERVELAHKASNRETFAHGALRAAEWLSAQKPGLYDMQNVLGLQ